MWKRYFKFVKLQPGRVVTALFGLIDFSDDNIPVEKIKALYESDFPYLQITEAGMEEFYGISPKTEEATETAAPTKQIIAAGRSRKQKRFS